MWTGAVYFCGSIDMERARQPKIEKLGTRQKGARQIWKKKKCKQTKQAK
jgi:hypothetical protein